MSWLDVCICVLWGRGWCWGLPAWRKGTEKSVQCVCVWKAAPPVRSRKGNGVVYHQQRVPPPLPPRFAHRARKEGGQVGVHWAVLLKGLRWRGCGGVGGVERVCILLFRLVSPPHHPSPASSYQVRMR